MNRFFAATLAQERLANSVVGSAVGDDLLLNRSVEILFDLSTCRTRCRGGDHVLESLAGRIVNQAVAAIMIDAAGLHDEAFGAVRSIGEITNLLAMFRLDPPTLRDWVGSSEADRRKRFSPVKVRIAIEREGGIAIPMDQAAYDRLCERYVHVSPATAPNAHGGDGLRHVGGFVQPAGAAELHEALAYIVVQAAMLMASMFGRRELGDELAKLVRSA